MIIVLSYATKKSSSLRKYADILMDKITYNWHLWEEVGASERMGHELIISEAG